MSKDENFVSVDTAAKRFAVKPRTIRDWLKSGKLRGVKLGTAPSGPGRYVWRIPESALAEFTEALPTNGVTASTSAD